MANIHDVARAAGVSISTVSYAISGKRSIAATTRRRVEEAVLALDYRPNAGARMLKGTRTNLLALSAPLHAGSHGPAHMAFVLAVINAARTFDYDVVLLTQDDATSGLRRVASSALVDGIILLDVSQDDERIELVRTLNVPTALVGVPRVTDELVCVDLDFERAAELSVQTLAAQGHTQIGLVGQDPLIYERGSNFPHRFRAAFEAEALRLGIDAAFVPSRENTASVRAAVDELAAELPAMTGLILHCNEPVQSMVLEVLDQRGIRIPADMSVISACSSFDTVHLNPPLDVIPLPASDTCGRAVALLMEQLSTGVEPRVELLPPTLVEHGSTAARQRV
ncbi:LacI family DNA-binding transcriptional regulator [Conyzicola nivalis]|uniref:LacI family transcriptional regulator n=1 Tax=Conyzicola nivalis TaxID=1477021 RepID=A0A916WMH0_9MICO|nr:LacI family DNA-binding transcriptional regulator [Conyzicola nivalis]GGB14574.1 LacI family transcriptional regulator [Conyzicola nivalis]